MENYHKALKGLADDPSATYVCTNCGAGYTRMAAAGKCIDCGGALLDRSSIRIPAESPGPRNGIFDDMKDKVKSVQEARYADKEYKRASVREEGILMQLKSSEGIVNLYEDRIEITNRIKSKYRVIPYGQIHALNFDKTPLASRLGTAMLTGGFNLAVPTKKTLIINAGRESVGLEFRVESVVDIRAAIAFINERIRQTTNGTPAATTVNTTVNVASPNGGQSIADELTKLAQLRADGVISESEFDAQKQRLLSGK